MVVTRKEMQQDIIHHSDTLIRAFANGFYWQNAIVPDAKLRNLGYVSTTQTHMKNYMKSVAMEWLGDNLAVIVKENKALFQGMAPATYLQTLAESSNTFSMGGPELFALSRAFQKNVRVVDQQGETVYSFDDFEDGRPIVIRCSRSAIDPTAPFVVEAVY
eukprot:Opistho-2@39435